MDLLKSIGKTLPKGGAGKLNHLVSIWALRGTEVQVPGMAVGVTTTTRTDTEIAAAVWASFKPMKSKDADDVRAAVEENVQYFEFTIRYRSTINTNYELREASSGRVFKVKQVYDGAQNKGHIQGVLEERRAEIG